MHDVIRHLNDCVSAAAAATSVAITRIPVALEPSTSKV